MKYIKLFENLEEVRFFSEIENKILMDKCLELFKLLWDEKLLLFKTNVVSLNFNNEYQFFSKINRDISQDSYKDFAELFGMLNNLKFKFQYGINRIDIFITDIEKFINEMEILKNVNKYNL